MLNQPKKLNINHLSYSFAKNVIKSGVDYAVGLKLGVFEKTMPAAVDVGTMVHSELLGTEQNFVVSPYENYRTKEAREWRDNQTLPIINEAQFEVIAYICERIKKHPLANNLLLGEGVEHEVKMTAKINDREWIGYADALKRTNEKIDYIVDLKTTSQFDDFKYQVGKMCYDVQASVYKTFAQNEDARFYWVIAETVEPYRIGVAVASVECEERGYDKLNRVVYQMEEFFNRKGNNDFERLNFDQNLSEDDILIIGDWSN